MAESVVVAVRLDRDLVAVVERLAVERGWSRGSCVKHLVRAGLETTYTTAVASSAPLPHRPVVAPPVGVPVTGEGYRQIAAIAERVALPHAAPVPAPVRPAVVRASELRPSRTACPDGSGVFRANPKSPLRCECGLPVGAHQ